MAFSFNSIGHFIAKILGTAKVVETVSAAVPVYGPLAVTVEKAAYAVLGELAAALTAGGDATSAKLSDAGLDIKVIETVQDIVKTGIPSLVDAIKSLTK